MKLEDFTGGFFWALPTKKKRKNPATKSREIGGSQIEVREKSVLPKIGPMFWDAGILSLNHVYWADSHNQIHHHILPQEDHSDVPQFVNVFAQMPILRKHRNVPGICQFPMSVLTETLPNNLSHGAPVSNTANAS